MNSYEIAKALHIIGVVLWIGGVAFVTFVLIPAIQRLDNIDNQYEFFEKIEHKFAWQARFSTLVTGLSGFFLIWKLDLWHRFGDIGYWWMHSMVLVWFIFTMMLFVIEPLFLHKWFKLKSKLDPVGLMKRVHRIHVLLVTISLITVFGAMIGVH